jgi:serine phosphatase RsbU (regulator of sigma subunit)/CHASE2 domain-containing sensor protein
VSIAAAGADELDVDADDADPPPGPTGPAGRRPGRQRWLGAALLGLMALFIADGAPGAGRMQAAWFDAHQTLWPRQVKDWPVTVVAIDQKSLLERGQWPWPRDQLAQLVRTIGEARPAAIGVNILMPEPDALSPERLLAESPIGDPMLTAALRSLPTHDGQLANALAETPSVLVIAGMPDATKLPLHAVPVTVHGLHAAAAAAPPLAPAVPLYGGALTSIAQLDQRASGWGLFSVASTRGIIRRMPLVASIDGTLVPALALEMLRVAQHAPSLRLAAVGAAVASVSVGRMNIRTEADGAVRVYFAQHGAQRFVSATDVLEGRVDSAALRDRLVLIGLTAVGLQEDQDTPIGERMSGTEIHAQLLENLVGGSLLRRPAAAPLIEAAALLALGSLLLWALPRWRTRRVAALLLACVAVPMALAVLAFRTERWLFDALTPGLVLMLFFGVLLVVSLGAARRQGRTLQRLVQDQREHSARIAGEMQAAQRVQMATLPRADLLRADRRIDLHATLQPAREVGGDLYDFFMLDTTRLFVLVGDVAGKGLPASIFMAVSKALTKSAMLRSPPAGHTAAGPAFDIGAVLAVANAEVSRDNPGHLFVTAFAAILDLHSGELHYCNAGHDNPYRLHASYAEPLRISDGDGPPLCALDDYDYQGACCRLLPGETLCMMTDGVTEAQTRTGALYGNDRLQRQLLALQRRSVAAQALVEALQADVTAFAAGAEPADDLTILALRWNGPDGAPA